MLTPSAVRDVQSLELGAATVLQRDQPTNSPTYERTNQPTNQQPSDQPTTQHAVHCSFVSLVCFLSPVPLWCARVRASVCCGVCPFGDDDLPEHCNLHRHVIVQALVTLIVGGVLYCRCLFLFSPVFLSWLLFFLHIQLCFPCTISNLIQHPPTNKPNQETRTILEYPTPTQCQPRM